MTLGFETCLQGLEQDKDVAGFCLMFSASFLTILFGSNQKAMAPDTKYVACTLLKRLD